jgi:hypothetical protein
MLYKGLWCYTLEPCWHYFTLLAGCMEWISEQEKEWVQHTTTGAFVLYYLDEWTRCIFSKLRLLMDNSCYEKFCSSLFIVDRGLTKFETRSIFGDIFIYVPPCEFLLKLSYWVVQTFSAWIKLNSFYTLQNLIYHTVVSHPMYFVRYIYLPHAPFCSVCDLDSWPILIQVRIIHI